MTSWKKYFSAVPTQTRLNARFEQQTRQESGVGGSTAKYSSFLPEVYSGAPNRVERYISYEQMDLDSEISKALDTISDFSTQTYESGDEPFKIEYKGNLTETEINLLKDSLQQWCSLNKWQQRLWRMFRNTIKYGDQIFIRDPQTFKLIWVDPTKVEKIIVNESEGKEIEQYVVRDLDFNLQTLVGTNMLVHDQYSFPGGYPRSSNPASGAGTVNYGQPSSPGSRSSRFDNPENSAAIDAEHVVHLSLSEGLDNQWPFGTSILESIYKVYKQKDLLEDSIIIYRIVRAPERRIFYIDVGSLQGPRAMQYVERIKNEIYQRRIPNRCLSLDTKIYLLDGRLIPLHQIISEYDSGKQNWVYSCDPKTGKVVPGKITWAGHTRSQTQVVKLTLDNGQTIICTPDHKFPILGKGFVQAQDLELGESFIPLYLRQESINNSKKAKYTQIFDNQSKKWVFTHRLVAEYFRDHTTSNSFVESFVFDNKFKNRPKHTVHHADYNRYNNNPENLIWMNSQDHICYHSHNAEFNKVKWENFKKDTERYAQYIENLNARSKSFWSNDQLRMKAVASRKLIYDNQLYVLFDNIVKTALKNNDLTVVNLDNIAKILTNNREYMNHFSDINYQFKNKNRLKTATHRDVKHLIKRVGGYKSTDEWLEDTLANVNVSIDYSAYRFNTKLLKIVDNHFNNSKKYTVQKLVKKLNNDEEFVNEFIKAHEESRINKKFKICRAYLLALIQYYGYKNFIDYRRKHNNKDWLNSRRSHIDLYNFTPEMFNIFKKHYTDCLHNLHYTQKKVGYFSLYKIVQSDLNFVREFKMANPTFNKKKFGPDFMINMLKSFGFENYDDFVEKYQYLNHKLVSIEWLDTPVDTGTITVDGDEQFHNYHTFAIEGGIFTKNSGGSASIIDAAYNPISINEDFFLATNSENKGTRIETLPGGENLGCFSLDTKILLLDGRNLSIQEIATEMSEGKTLWTYSCHPVTGAIAPGLITWAGKTKSNATVLKITLNNGNTVVCTPDHRFPILGKGLTQAQDLQIGQSLMAMNFKNKQIYDYGTDSWYDQDNLVLIQTAYSESQGYQISSIDYLPDTIDVGTLTIDGDEIYHNWHTYTLSIGVATQNSIDDLKYFNNKMIRGLGIPSSYLPTGADDGTTAYNDGKVGTAYVQEYRFSKYCQRLQNLMISTIDHEFKMFLKKRGIEISSNLFELQFWPPQSFSQYRQMQMDSEQIQVFANLMGTEANKYVSKRFAMQRYLGWSEEDILKNEQLWKEENAKKVKEKIGKAPGDADRVGLGSIGIRPPEAGMGDLGMPGEEAPEMGAEATPSELSPGGAVPPTAPVGGGAAAPGVPAEI